MNCQFSKAPKLIINCAKATANKNLYRKQTNPATCGKLVFARALTPKNSSFTRTESDQQLFKQEPGNKHNQKQRQRAGQNFKIVSGTHPKPLKKRLRTLMRPSLLLLRPPQAPQAATIVSLFEKRVQQACRITVSGTKKNRICFGDHNCFEKVARKPTSRNQRASKTPTSQQTRGNQVH